MSNSFTNQVLVRLSLEKIIKIMKIRFICCQSYPATLSVTYVGYSLINKEVIDDIYIFYLKKNVELEEVNIKSKSNTTTLSTVKTINTQTITDGEIKKAACCNLLCFEQIQRSMLIIQMEYLAKEQLRC